MNIHDKLAYATQKWKLTDITIIYEKNGRAVYRAVSKDLGGVILKINSNAKELCHEAAMLKALDENGCCRLYVYEEEPGILLEELIVPGTTLREERDFGKRVEGFASAFEKIHESIICPKQTESYLDWLASAKGFCEESVRSGSVEVQAILRESGLLEKMQRAYEIGEEMFAGYPERVLLHGDLHHDNILVNAEGGYSVIDPKGVLGPKIFDVPRFVLNEWGYVKGRSVEERKEHLEQAIRLISERLGYPVQDITRLLFMETILASVWCIEDGEEIDEWKVRVIEELER